MANNLSIEFSGITDAGLVRAQNEDAIAIGHERGFAVLADGMGGYNAGEVASGIATSVAKDVLEQGLGTADTIAEDTRPLDRDFHQLLVDAVKSANKAILSAAAAEPGYHGMGTTLVAAIFHADRLTIAHVGDSRAYRFRLGELSRITRDHSLLQEQIDAGLIDPAMARFAHTRNLVTRAVGVGAEVDVEVHEHTMQAGDIYLMCSDGLTDMLPDEEISAILAQFPDLEAACGALVQKANDNGGLDNISVILMRVKSVGAQGPGLLGRILNWVS